MKNFFKKLSFVLASAMVITSLYAPANTSAAAKDGIILKGKAVTKKGIFVGGEKVNFDYKIGKHNNKGANGKWSVSDTSVITVDKHGKVTAVGTGSATLYLKVKKNAKKGIKKNLTFKVKINAMARADKLTIPASDKAITLKVGEVKDIMPVLTDKVEGVKNTYTLFARTDNPTDVAVEVKDNAKVVVTANNPTATSATITVFAAQKSNEDDAFNNKYKQQDTFTVDVKPNLEAMQSAANKITVKGMDLSTSAAAYVLKNDKGVVQNLKSVTADKDGNIVLESNLAQYPEGKYVVIYDKNELPVDVEKSMSKEIKLMPEDKAIAVYNTGAQKYDKAYVKYAIYDQFGTDVTGTSLVNVRISGSHGAAAVANEPNKIEFTDNGSLGFQLGISKVSISLYDLNNTKMAVSLNATLDVANESKIYEAEFAGLWDEGASKFVQSFEESQDLTKNPIYALYTFKDQYGNVVNYKDGLEKEVNVLPIGITNVTIDYTTPTDVIKKVEDKANKKEYVGFKLSAIPNSKLREGEVELRTSIFTNASKNLVNKFNVTHAVKVHDINIFVGAKGLYAGQKNELAFTATDQDGKPVKAYKYLKNVKLSDSKFAWEATDENDDSSDAKLTFDASGETVAGTNDTASQPFYFVATTETNQIKQFNLSINKKRVVAGVTGLQDKVAVGVTKDNTLVLRYNDLKFQDQYGGAVSAKEIVDVIKVDTYVKAEFVNSTQDIFTVVGSLVNGTAKIVENSVDNNDNASKVAELTAKGAKSANEQLKITVHSATPATDDNMIGSPLTVDLHSVLLNDVTDIKVTEPKVQSVADAYAQANTGYTTTNIATLYDFLPEVTGKYRGQTIKLVNKNDFTIIDAAGAGDYVNVPKLEAFNNQANTVKELETSFKLLFKTGEITETKYKFTKDKPVITKISIKDDKKVVDLGTVAATAKNGWDAIKTKLDFEDQFGRKNKIDVADITPYIVFTKADTEANNKLITIEKNATKEATFSIAKDNTPGIAAQPDVKVKVKIVVGSYVFETLIKVKNNGA